MPAKLPGFRAPYWKVEHALVRTHGIKPGDELRLRSRFGALQRGGLLGAENQPGKGSKLTYTPDQFHRAVFGFEMAQFGVPPAVILRLVKTFWDTDLRDIFTRAEHAIVHPRRGGDIILVLSDIALVTDGERATPRILAMPLREYARKLLKGALHSRSLVVNLSSQLQKFHAGLVEVNLLDRPPETSASESDDEAA